MPTDDELGKKNTGNPPLSSSLKPVLSGSKGGRQGGEPPEAPAWRRLSQSLSAKLIALLVAAMLVIFTVLGYANIRLHRQNLEASTLQAAERVSDVIKRSTSYHMLRNDRDALY